MIYCKVFNMTGVRHFGINTFAITKIFFCCVIIVISLVGAVSLLAIYSLLISEDGGDDLADLLSEEVLEHSLINEFALVSALSFVLMFFIAIAGLVAAVGVLKTKLWARKLIIQISLGILCLTFIVTLIEFSLGMLGYSLGFYIYLIWFFFKITFYSFLIEFFSKPKIKKYFEEENDYY